MASADGPLATHTVGSRVWVLAAAGGVSSSSSSSEPEWQQGEVLAIRDGQHLVVRAEAGAEVLGPAESFPLQNLDAQGGVEVRVGVKQQQRVGLFGSKPQLRQEEGRQAAGAAVLLLLQRGGMQGVCVCVHTGAARGQQGLPAARLERIHAGNTHAHTRT